MKRELTAAMAAALVALLPAVSHGAVVHSDYRPLGTDTWLADFRIVNDGNPGSIAGFTVYFSETMFSNLTRVAAPSTWDSLLIQPDLGLPSAGFLDSFVIDSADAIGLGEEQGGFSVQFELLGGGLPGALPFTINDANFNVLFSGDTVAAVIPEPATLLLAAMGVLAALGSSRHARSAGQHARAVAA